MDEIKKLKELIEKSNYIVFFGGAGVSTESGIPDFRSVDGLYNQKYKYPPETILSHSFFVKHTNEFYNFYKDKMIFTDKMPNKAHFALAALEKTGKLKAIITQNIDGLHQMAGSKNVLELHGSIHRNFCMTCKKSYPLDYIVKSQGIPVCLCEGTIKPDVVLYEEGLDTSIIQEAIFHIQNADMIIIGGTSLGVYPAAGLIDYFGGENIVLINRDKTQRDYLAKLIIREKIGEVLSKALEE